MLLRHQRKHILENQLTTNPEWRIGCELASCVGGKGTLVCGEHLYLAVEAQGVLLVKGGGNGHSIGSSASDAIVCCLLWSTATRSCPFCYFGSSNSNLNSYDLLRTEIYIEHKIF